MEEIYSLIGKILEKFQIFEQQLYLLLYIGTKKNCCENDDYAQIEQLYNFTKMEKASLGKKFEKIKDLKIIADERSVDLIEYFITTRNKITHYFFIENNLKTKKDIISSIKELNIVNEDFKMINSAIKKYLIDYAKENKV